MAGFKRGTPLKKIGLHAQDTSELFFDNVIVPKINLLGEATKGFAYLAQFLAGERLIAAVDGVPLAQTAFDLTLDYVQAAQRLRAPHRHLPEQPLHPGGIARGDRCRADLHRPVRAGVQRRAA